MEDGRGIRLGKGMDVRSTGLLSPVTRSLLEGLHFTRGDGAEVWTAPRRQLPGSWDVSLRPPGYNRLVGVEWRLWEANGVCPIVVMWPRRSGPSPSWETIVVVWNWVTIRGVGGHAFMALRGTAVDKDGRVAPQLIAERPPAWSWSPSNGVPKGLNPGGADCPRPMEGPADFAGHQLAK